MATPDHDRFRERFVEGEFAADRLADDALDLELVSTYAIAGEYLPALSTAQRELAAMYLAAHNLTAEQAGSSHSDSPGTAVSQSAGGIPRDPLDATKYGRAFKTIVRGRRRGIPAGTNYCGAIGMVA